MVGSRRDAPRCFGVTEPVDSERKQVINASLTLGAAVGVTALSFGLAAVSAGASVWQACTLSFFTFTGASQFSAMSVVGAGGSPAAAFGGAALLAVRNFVYGLVLAGRVGRDDEGRRLSRPSPRCRALCD